MYFIKQVGLFAAAIAITSTQLFTQCHAKDCTENGYKGKTYGTNASDQSIPLKIISNDDEYFVKGIESFTITSTGKTTANNSITGASISNSGDYKYSIDFTVENANDDYACYSVSEPFNDDFDYSKMIPTTYHSSKNDDVCMNGPYMGVYYVVGDLVVKVINIYNSEGSSEYKTVQIKDLYIMREVYTFDDDNYDIVWWLASDNCCGNEISGSCSGTSSAQLTCLAQDGLTPITIGINDDDGFTVTQIIDGTVNSCIDDL